MKNTFYAIPIFLPLLIFSCTNTGQEGYKVDGRNEDSAEIIDSQIIPIYRDSILKQLQGKWKEVDYPYRQVDFKDSTVKFIEEGLAADPVFSEFTISRECPFSVNNIPNAGPDDVFLVLPAEGRCEKLTVSNNTLILTGFSTNTNNNYQIIYKKLD